MMDFFFRVRKYLQYQRTAKTKYYLHSPFVYQFYLNVLEGADDDNLRSLKKGRQAMLPFKYGMLLYRLVKYFQPQAILQLGTSISNVSSFVLLGNPEVKVVSLTDISPASLSELRSADVIFVNATIPLIQDISACLDHANENAIIVFDGINSRKAMGEIWEVIKTHQRVTLTIDVFRFGICFLKKGKLAKEHFALRY